MQPESMTGEELATWAERYAIDQAHLSHSTDKSEWIRLWVKARRFLSKSHDAEDWEEAMREARPGGVTKPEQL